jgi:hypothetical protein
MFAAGLTLKKEESFSIGSEYLKEISNSSLYVFPADLHQMIFGFIHISRKKY